MGAGEERALDWQYAYETVKQQVCRNCACTQLTSQNKTTEELKTQESNLLSLLQKATTLLDYGWTQAARQMKSSMN